MRYVKKTGKVALIGRRDGRDEIRWYDISDFMQLRDVLDQERPPLPERADRDPLALRGSYEYHRPGQPLSDRARLVRRVTLH